MPDRFPHGRIDANEMELWKRFYSEREKERENRKRQR